MKIWKYIILLAALAIWGAGCSKDPSVGGEDPSDGTVKLRMMVRTPETRIPTRAVAEEEVTSVYVLVFEDTGDGLTYRYVVQGYSLTPVTGQNYDYEFLARIIPGTNPMRLYMVANAPAVINSVTAGMTEQQAKNAMTMAYASAGFTNVLPMSGVLDYPSGITVNTTSNGVLLRSAARVDVVNNAPGFNLTSVRIYRANNLVQVVPNTLVGNSVTTASIPAGATQNVNSVTFPVTGNIITEEIYIPESALPAVADRRLGATSVVVGGQYDGSTQTTYYRMDFIPNDQDDNPQDGLFGQVLRNHLYRFEIQDVLAPGWNTDDDASIYPSTGIQVEIQAWDEETVYMVFDDYNYLGVSRRAVRLSYPAGVDLSVDVETNLDSYQAYWGNADGTYDEQDGPIEFGGDLDDPDGLYNAAISADGSEVIFTTLTTFDAATTQTKYLVLVAGRMRIVVAVSQGPPVYGDRPVSVFGEIRELGSFGLYSLTAGWGRDPGDRALGLGAMLNGPVSNVGSPNFGPGKPVDMRGFNISGVSLVDNMPAYYYEPFDVLYLPYPNNIPQAQVNQMLAWLEADEHRVLIVHFDNNVTNPAMMATLGFSGSNIVTTNQSITPFSYAGNENVPDFIRSGPFGNITGPFNHKCRDAAYGTVNPATADALGYVPIYIGNSTGNGGVSNGYYAMAVNTERRIIICGDSDFYSNRTDGNNTGVYYLDLYRDTPANSTIDPANPAHVVMGNLWAWIVDVVLRED